jgi:hypothetical protein
MRAAASGAPAPDSMEKTNGSAAGSNLQLLAHDGTKKHLSY